MLLPQILMRQLKRRPPGNRTSPSSQSHNVVVRAEAGIQAKKMRDECASVWIPAYAGMTE